MPGIKRNLGTLTKAEVLALLEDLPDETPIMFGYNYGDRCNTQIAGRIETGQLKVISYSDYHKEYKVDKENDDVEEYGIKTAFILT